MAEIHCPNCKTPATDSRVKIKRLSSKSTQIQCYVCGQWTIIHHILTGKREYVALPPYGGRK